MVRVCQSFVADEVAKGLQKCVSSSTSFTTNSEAKLIRVSLLLPSVAACFQPGADRRAVQYSGGTTTDKGHVVCSVQVPCQSLSSQHECLANCY